MKLIIVLFLNILLAIISGILINKVRKKIEGAYTEKSDNA